MTERRRPVEPFGGGDHERKRAARRRPAWQSQHEGMRRDQASHAAPEHDYPAHQPPPMRQREPEPYHAPYDEEYERPGKQEVYDGEGLKAGGAVMFLLIFGVGNYLLYKYTGWLIIPIPRK